MGRILGLRSIPLSGAAGFTQVTSGVAQGHAQPASGRPPVSGVARLWWRISSVIVAGAPATRPPRVRIAWTVHDESANGNLLNPPTPTPPGAFDPDSASQGPSMLCDAWYGQIELLGTSFSISAGYLPEDIADASSYIVQGVICEGGTGAQQFATFTRPVTIPGGGGGNVDVFIPGATGALNNGAHRAQTVQWKNGTVLDAALTFFDFAGVAIDVSRTGAPVAPAPYVPAPINLDPSVFRINVTTGAATTNGRLIFSYF